MTSAWELISTERQGHAGRRALVAKTFRMPDGSQAVFTITADTDSRAVACVALTPRHTAVLAEQYRPGPAEFVTAAEAPLGDLVGLAMTGAMTDPGGVLLALPYLMDDPGVRSVLTSRPR